MQSVEMSDFFGMKLYIIGPPELGSFPVLLLTPPPSVDYLPPTPIEAVAVATSVFTEYVFCESVDSVHKSQISSNLQEADCLLKPVKVNTWVFSKTSLNRNLNHIAQLSISQGGHINFVSRAGGKKIQKTPEL